MKKTFILFNFDLSFNIYCLLLCFFLSPAFSFGQFQQQLGLPKILHYDRAEYNAYNQNWGIAQDEQEILYFANSKGLLSYNGNQWQVNELPLGQVVRSVAVNGQGRVYTGGYAEIGYWEKQPYGKLKYHSYARARERI